MKKVVFLLLVFLISIQSVAQTGCGLPEPLCKAQSEYDKADAQLNKVYRSIIDKIESNDFEDFLVVKEELEKSLTNAQRAWLKYRDSNCEAYYTLHSGGTSKNIDLLECLGNMTAERTQYLQKLYL